MSKQEQQNKEKGVPDMRFFMPVSDSLIRPYQPGSTPLVEICARWESVHKEIENMLFNFGGDANVIRQFANARDAFQKMVTATVAEHNGRIEKGSDDPDVQKLIDAGKQMAEASRRMAAQANGQGPAPEPEIEGDGEEGEGGKVIGKIDTRTPEPPKKGGKAGTKKKSASKKKKPNARKAVKKKPAKKSAPKKKKGAKK